MKYFAELEKAALAEDELATEDVLAMIEEADNSIEYVDSILRLMENHPEIDYGAPGPLVHYIKRYFTRGYEELLLASVKRTPTPHTLWMLNRIINSPKLKDRENYLEALQEVADNPGIPEATRQEAKDFLDFQEG